MIKDVNGRDVVEKLYIYLKESVKGICFELTPYLRRLLRFLALPYCYIFLVNWKKCPRSYSGVIYDFLYIFFVLKYFPDNYSPCELWSYPREEWKFFYGSNYEPFQRAKLRKCVQKKKYEVLYEDKWVCGELCNSKNIVTPRTIGVIHPGSNSTSECLDLIFSQKRSGRFLLKPIDGKGGHAIKIIEISEAKAVKVIHPENESFSDALIKTPHLIQEYLTQHPEMSKFSSSTNTTRVVSMMKRDGSVFIQGAYVRFGAANGLLDNLSQGGLAVPVDLDSGMLGKYGYDRKGVAYESHPGSGTKFEGFVMPHWEEVIAVGKDVQSGLSFQRLLGMDIAIGEEGPVVIEINSIYDNVDFEQMCGPILKNKEVLNEYGNYGLLINRKQREIFEELGNE